MPAHFHCQGLVHYCSHELMSVLCQDLAAEHHLSRKLMPAHFLCQGLVSKQYLFQELNTGPLHSQELVSLFYHSPSS